MRMILTFTIIITLMINRHITETLATLTGKDSVRETACSYSIQLNNRSKSKQLTYMIALIKISFKSKSQ